MPKYLAVNYVAEALKKRHALLERMLLLPPQHLEHVDNYIHKGDLPDLTYLSPWQSEKFDWSSEELPLENGAALCSDVLCSLNVDENCLEYYDVTDGIGLDVDSSKTVIDDSMSAEIELAMEKAGIGMWYGKEEEFIPEILDTWNTTVLAEGAHWLLEEVVPSKPLITLMEDIPCVSQLCTRLKPKMVQDPLQGDHLNHLYIFRKDNYHMDDDADMDMTSKPVGQELFNKEPLPVDQDEDDDKEQLVGMLEEPHITCSLDLPLPLPTLKSSPSSDHEACIPTDLSGLMANNEEQMVLSSLSPAPLLDYTTFVDLNDESPSGTDGDSGVNLLESPCVEGGTWITPTIGALHSLHKMDPFPISPDWNMSTAIMSFKDKEKCIQEMWQKERIFDDLLALILPVPDISNGLHLESVYTLAITVLHPTHVPLDTSMELDMGWDPLCGSHNHLIAAQSSLCQLLRNPDDGGVSVLSWQSYQEIFPIEPSLLHIIIDDEDEQLSIVSKPGGGVALERYDMPFPPKVTDSRSINDDNKRASFVTSAVMKEHLDKHQSSFLDDFIMLRTSTNSASSLQPINNDVYSGDDQIESDDNTGVVERCQTVEVSLSDDYTSVLEYILNAVTHVLDIVHQTEDIFPYSLSNLTVNEVKRFFKKQAASFNFDSNNGEMQDLYKLAVLLFIYYSTVDVLLHCSPAIAMSQLMGLQEQYYNIIGRELEPLRVEMVDLQVGLKERRCAHPKMEHLRTVICHWITKNEQRRRKALVVLEREFPSLSVEILDIFQSIKGLSACVHFWTPSDGTMDKYQDTVENRFHYYDCLVVPKYSLTTQFPWQRVSLLVEYEHTVDITLPNNVPSLEHVMLKCVSHSFPGLSGQDANSLNQGEISVTNKEQYTFIGSEILTQNSELLRLLETKQNITVLERQYSIIIPPMKSRCCIATADVIIDTRSGILLRHISELEESSGLKEIVNLIYILCKQYELLWIILYCTSDDGYPYAGDVTINISRLHASLAHFDIMTDEFQAKVVHVGSMVDVADIIRSIGEQAHRTDMVWGSTGWGNRSWLCTDISKHEAFLLSFCSVNSFSAQVMLAVCSLQQLLTMSLSQLTATIPWVPAKVLKNFHSVAHFCKTTDNSFTECSNAEPGAAVTTDTDDDDLVRDSLSEAEAYSSPNHHQQSPLLQYTFTSTTGMSPVLSDADNRTGHTKPTGSQNRWHNDADLFQSFDHHQNVIRGNMVSRSASRAKTPLKAVDVDISNTSYSLQTNDRTMVRNPKTVSDYESHDQYKEYASSNLPGIMRQTAGNSNVVSLFGYYGRQQKTVHKSDQVSADNRVVCSTDRDAFIFSPNL
ncbi:uncharacterized protein [Dysidea avara]|uniref:uncharacterized protein isoform X2 n=1 Tax=Dysidea avara TaxID=196820 RepID=UPI003317FE9C